MEWVQVNFNNFYLALKCENTGQAHKEISNTFIQIKGLYERFQNNNVKHDDNINPKEVEYIFQQTLCFMNLLLKVQ